MAFALTSLHLSKHDFTLDFRRKGINVYAIMKFKNKMEIKIDSDTSVRKERKVGCLTRYWTKPKTCLQPITGGFIAFPKGASTVIHC